MVKRLRGDGEDTTTSVESDRESIDRAWASLLDGSDRDGAEDRSDRAETSALRELQTAYDAATRRAADWYSSKLGTNGDQMHRGRAPHVSRHAAPAAEDDRATRRTAGVDR